MLYAMWSKLAYGFINLNNILSGDLLLLYDIYIKKKEPTKSKKTINHIV